VGEGEEHVALLALWGGGGEAGEGGEGAAGRRGGRVSMRGSDSSSAAVQHAGMLALA
jgi:hypothetical protein